MAGGKQISVMFVVFLGLQMALCSVVRGAGEYIVY